MRVVHHPLDCVVEFNRFNIDAYAMIRDFDKEWFLFDCVCLREKKPRVDHLLQTVQTDLAVLTALIDIQAWDNTWKILQSWNCKSKLLAQVHFSAPFGKHLQKILCNVRSIEPLIALQRVSQFTRLDYEKWCVGLLAGEARAHRRRVHANRRIERKPRIEKCVRKWKRNITKCDNEGKNRKRSQKKTVKAFGEWHPPDGGLTRSKRKSKCNIHKWNQVECFHVLEKQQWKVWLDNENENVRERGDRGKN